MERARKHGQRVGRLKVTDRRGFNRRFEDALVRLNTGEISQREASQELGISNATLKRLLDTQIRNDGGDGGESNDT